MGTDFIASVSSVGKRLTAHIDEPVKSSDGKRTLILRKAEETGDRATKGAMRYRVHMNLPMPGTQ